VGRTRRKSMIAFSILAKFLVFRAGEHAGPSKAGHQPLYSAPKKNDTRR
jgi:hypothetical protein